MQTATYTVKTNRRIDTDPQHEPSRVEGMDVVGGKTGFISKSGYCLATLLRLPQSNNQVAFVVLGAQSNPGRFWETRHLFNWLSERASCSSPRKSCQSSPGNRSYL